ncbi:MAG: ATP-binding protein [Campylobacteraceae bacterium]|nr:ATP-binding protein [Campylobacteraceae bacterium]
MKYRESHIDRNLRKWFINDNEHCLLRSISLTKGNIRSLTPFEISLNYPITAIAGKNGSGKSTILALACCAFHNNKEGFKLPHRKSTYYTFADFFVQHTDDVPYEGIEIIYSIAHNNWKKSKIIPNGTGVSSQKRVKKKGGKWTDYSRRVLRDVVFLGIERIVPHSEKSQSKSYSKSFHYLGEKGWENDVKDTVGKILGKKYDTFRYVTHSKYRLPLVVSNGKKYSGFHMGAGENALFELFSILYSVEEGALVVIDEIELGLHSEAQKKLITNLKILCKKRKIQIICTTHSKDIFNQLPDDARIFIEKINELSIVNDSISPEFAFSKLSAENSFEMCVLVEDIVAKTLLTSILPSSIRSRISIEIIGSASALIRQLSSNYIREKKENIIIIFDGDQVSKENKNLLHGYKMTESTDNEEDIKNWMKQNIEYLPGSTWPESWIVQKCFESINYLAPLLGVNEDELNDIIEQGLEAGKHNEFNEIGKAIGLGTQDVLTKFCIAINHCHSSYFDELIKSIQERLNR